MRRFLFAVTIGLLGFCLLSPETTRAASSSVVISEFRVRGPNGGNDEFIELYNLSTVPVNIGGWKIAGSNNAGTTSVRATVPAATTLPAGCHFLLTNSSASGGPYSGAIPGNLQYSTGITDDGGIALLDAANAIVDQVGMHVSSAFKEGTILTPLGSSNLNRSYERKPGGSAGSSTDTDDNASDFQLMSPSDPQNLASPCIQTGGPTATGSASPNPVTSGATTTLTVNVTLGNPPVPIASVTANLTSIGGAAAAPMSPAGGLTYALAVTVPASTSPGTKNIAVTINEDGPTSRVGSAVIALTVEPPPPSVIAIHDIQGPGVVSPYEGQIVETHGIVTALRFNNGFFIQTPDDEVDGDANTSEGLFVFTGTGNIPAAAVVGNLVRVIGSVQEFRGDPFSPPQTEISGNPITSVLAGAEPLPAAVTLTAADTSPTGSIEQLERYEGMRVHVDSLTVVAPTQGRVVEATAVGNTNGVYVGVITDVARPFREPGIEVPDPIPPTPACCVPRFDANPERIRVDSNGQVGFGANDTTEVMTGAIVTNVTGVLDYNSRAYTILPDHDAQGTVSGLHGFTAVASAGPHQFTIATANVERFFDTTDDAGVSDVVLTATAFANRLNKVSLQIRVVMGAPDIIGFEEIENLGVLQAIADKVNDDAAGAVSYAAYLVEGNDIGGIDVGFLVNTLRVTVNAVQQEGLTTTYVEPSGRVSLLNDRPPLVLDATVHTPADAPVDVTVIANHLRSLNGIDDPAGGARVRAKRLAQAEFLAQLVQDLQQANPSRPIVAVGDFNAFQFSDGYVDVIGIAKGTPAPADQVVLAGGAAIVSPPLTDLVDLAPEDQRYSFSFDGNAQALDHILVSASALPLFSSIQWGRSNTDFPETFRTDPNRPERISDHDPLVAYFSMPALTTTTVTLAPNPVDFSADITFTATVSTADLPVTSGSVHFTDGAGFDADAPVSAGQASMTVDAAAFGLGTHTVTGSFANGAFYAPSSGSGSFEVRDLTPPSAPTLSVSPSVLWPPNNKLVPVQVTAQSADAIDPSPACAIVTITSHDRDDRRRGRHDDDDIVITGPLTAKLRAEKNDGPRDVIFTVTVACRDAAGNAGDASTVNVIVPHDRGHGGW